MKPVYDSMPRVPAATPNRDAVRLRIFETTCVARVSASTYVWWCLLVARAYLSIVLHASQNNGGNGKLSFFIHGERNYAQLCNRIVGCWEVTEMHSAEGWLSVEMQLAVQGGSRVSPCAIRGDLGMLGT